VCCLVRSLIDPDGGVTTYTFDSVGRLDNLINPFAERTTFGYDADNREKLKQLANGARTSFSYDAASHLKQLYHLKSDNSVLESFDYDYDVTGNRIGSQESSGIRTTWTYDFNYQLTHEERGGPLGWVPLTLNQWSDLTLDQWVNLDLQGSAYTLTHTYDPVGNRLVKNQSGSLTTFTYDAANQLQTSVASAGVTTYTYDKAGNQQFVLAPANARTTSVWDDENRQSRLLLPDGKITTAMYRYDGLRYQKADSSGTTKFIYDGQNYLQETDGSNAVQAVFTNEPQAYGKLISQRRQEP
jgi:YD repeat-containing protein